MHSPIYAHTGHDSRELARGLLEEAHVALIPGESFGENGAGYLRLSYAASEADLKEALKRMRDFLSR
jgi:aminotransferase